MKKYLKRFALYYIALLIVGIAASGVLWIGLFFGELFGFVTGVLSAFLLLITFVAAFEALGDEDDEDGGGSR